MMYACSALCWKVCEVAVHADAVLKGTVVDLTIGDEDACSDIAPRDEEEPFSRAGQWAFACSGGNTMCGSMGS